MRKTWVLTDTHFNHAKIIKYEDRPADFKERIISNWRDMVGPYDLVIHLGDVIFNSKHELLGILESMPGVKILTMGNHDKRTGTATWFMRMGFNYVCKYHVIDDVLLSHKPLDLAQYPGVKYNVHGHFHRNSHTPGDLQYPYYDVDRHIKLSIEECDYKPVLLADLMASATNK